MNSVFENRKLFFLEAEHSISQHSHQFSLSFVNFLNYRDFHVLFLLLLVWSWGINPNVPISSDDCSDNWLRISKKLNYVIFHSPNEIWVQFQKEAIEKLSILEISGLDLDPSITWVNLHNLSRDNISLFEEASHVKLVLLRPSSLDTSGQIYGSQVQNWVLIRIDIHYPPLLVYIDNSSDHNISNVWPIALS